MKLKRVKHKKATSLTINKTIAFAVALVFLVLLILIFPTKVWNKTKDFFGVFNISKENVNKESDTTKTFEMQIQFQKAVNDCLRKNDDNCYCKADMAMLNPEYRLVIDNIENKIYVEDKDKKIVSEKIDLGSNVYALAKKSVLSDKLSEDLPLKMKIYYTINLGKEGYSPVMEEIFSKGDEKKPLTVPVVDNRLIKRGSNIYLYVESPENFNKKIRQCKSSSNWFELVISAIENCKNSKGNLCSCGLNMERAGNEKIRISGNSITLLDKNNKEIRTEKISSSICLIASQFSGPGKHEVITEKEMLLWFDKGKAYLSTEKNKNFVIGTDKLIRYNYKSKDYVCFYNDVLESKTIAKHAKGCES